jgi:hypothetical protein
VRPGRAGDQQQQAGADADADADLHAEAEGGHEGDRQHREVPPVGAPGATRAGTSTRPATATITIEASTARGM